MGLPRGRASATDARPQGRTQGPSPSPSINIGTVDALPLPSGAATDATLLTTIAPTVTYTHSKVTTGTDALALASNAAARYRRFQNIDATNSLSIALNVTAVANTQIVLFPKDVFVMSRTMGNMDTRDVRCVANAGTPILLITEGV